MQVPFCFIDLASSPPMPSGEPVGHFLFLEGSKEPPKTHAFTYLVEVSR